MPRRPPHPTIDGFWDTLQEAAANYIDNAARAILRDFQQGLGGGFDQGPAQARSRTSNLKGRPPSHPPILKRASPMRIQRPKTWTQLCNWLAGLGLGNRYYQEDGPITLTNIQAVTVHATDKDGQPRSLQLVLDPEWVNPWVNGDGTGPRRKG